MIQLLARIFITKKNTGKDFKDYEDENVRRKYGEICSLFSVFLNLLLFVGKWIIGFLSSSIAIISDAFNNLSDASSSVISVVGFHLSGKKPDSKHPFGYGRFEYISALIVSMLILFMGFSLAKSSVTRIFHPQKVEVSIVLLVILGASVLVKLYMGIYYRIYAKRINSGTLAAAGMDSFMDIVSTLVVLVSGIVGKFVDFNVDGYVGLAVSVFILYSGFETFKETVRPLLGTQIPKKMADDIENAVLAHPEVLGIHDLLVHDYGPKRKILSMHIEVDGKMALQEAHDVIDKIENELDVKFGVESVLHIDPIIEEDEQTAAIRKVVEEVLKSIDENLTYHDFKVSSLRCVQFEDNKVVTYQDQKKQHKNEYLRVSFDVRISDKVSLKIDDEALKKKICDEVSKQRSDCVCNIRCDRNIF